ncbi:MAG: ribosomal protein S18-alanine N-acetyltransferase [Wenzhouxiangellaceae bacterium]
MAAVLQGGLHFRDMTPADLDRVHAVEQASYPFPWSRGIFADCLAVGYRCKVAEDCGVLAGYSVLSTGAGEAHLLNLCVAPGYRRCGLGQRLLEQVIADAGHAGCERLFLEVRPSNQAAMALYRRNAFRVIGRRPGYYPAASGREDALVMVLRLDGSADG